MTTITFSFIDAFPSEKSQSEDADGMPIDDIREERRADVSLSACDTPDPNLLIALAAVSANSTTVAQLPRPA